MLLSEYLMHPDDDAVDGRGDILSDVGDGIFSTINTPNTSANDVEASSYCVPAPKMPCVSPSLTGTRNGVSWRAVHYAARSNHTGGVNVGLADGSVTFVQDNIDINVWKAMSTMNGSETVDAVN